MHIHPPEPNPARGIGCTALAFYAMNTVEDSFTQGPGSSTDAKGQKVDPEDMAEGGTYTNDLQSLTVDNISPEVYAELPFLCADLTVVNNSDAEPLDISAFDWKMQSPDGTIQQMPTHLGQDNALQDVRLAPGTTKTFNMCFEASGHNGVYSFTYDPTFFTTEDKPTWSIELTDE